MREEHRLVNIETKLAYQEDLLQALNDIVEQQQQQITRLEQRYHNLSERLAAAAESPLADGDERPPHY